MNEKMKIKCGPGPNGEFFTGSVKSIHRNKFPCKSIRPNQSASVCFSVSDELPILRSGMVLVADNDETSASIFFQVSDERPQMLIDRLLIQTFVRSQATIVVIHHPSIKGIKKGFQNTIHIGSIRQTAVIEGIFGRDSLCANDTGSCFFRFLIRPEYVKVGMSLLFREGRTKGVGCVTQIFPLV